MVFCMQTQVSSCVSRAFCPQVVEAMLNGELEEGSAAADEGLKDLSHKLWEFFSGMPLDCDIFAASQGLVRRRYTSSFAVCIPYCPK